MSAFKVVIFQMPLMMLAMVLLQSSRAVASSRRFCEVLDTEMDLTDDNASHKDMQVTRGQIEFRRVGFRFLRIGRSGACF